MFKADDLVDALFDEIQKRSPASPRSGELKGRKFLSEYDIKKLLTPGSQVLRIPRGAILSPLAQDWLALKGVRAVSE